MTITKQSLKAIDQQGLLKEGFPTTHLNAFLQTAKDSDCVIMSRTPGEVCEMLLREDYDGKSFFIKSKSCNWGPMAGFVCLDPSLNKNKSKGTLSNLKYSLHALVDKYDGETASATQILINKDRLNWLLKYDATKNNFTKANDNLYQYNDANFHGILIKRKDGLWALYYDIKQFYNVTQGDFWQSIGDAFKNKYDAQINQASQKKDDATKERKEIEKTIKDFWEAAKPLFDKNKSKQNTDLANAGSNYKGYLPVMGLTNPFSSFSNDLEYKNAVTGDYDLYAIWPKVPSKDDERVAGMFKNLEDKALIKAEGKSPIGELVGNISNRIYFLAQMINSLIPSPTGKCPNRVFHSDECGRPFVDEIDSAVAFSPQGDTFLIENAQDLANMVKYFKQEGYTCFINKGWLNDLKNHGVAENQVSWSNQI